MMMANRAGAERVTGCEVDPDMITLATQVAQDNAMPSSGPQSFDIAPIPFQSALLDQDLQGQFNVLVAELLDDCGLGEQMWPFFTLAKQRLLGPNPVIVPRRLTLYAALVHVELAHVGGAMLW